MGLYTYLYWNLPYWIPLWFVETPGDTIDKRLPPTTDLRDDAVRYLRDSDMVLEEKFFSLFALDLNEDCPLWARDDICKSKNLCTLERCCETDIPTEIMDSRNTVVKIGGSEDPWGSYEVMLQRSFRMDDAQGMFGSSREQKLDYYDLTVNKPGNTNYRGRSLWGYLYKNACLPHEEGGSDPLSCNESEVYTRLISGMQTVIAALNAEHSTDEERGGWMNVTYNMQYFKMAVAHNRSWIENLYFTYGMLMRSYSKLSGLMSSLECPTTSNLCQKFPQFLQREKEYRSHEYYRSHPEAIFPNLAFNAFEKMKEVDSIMNCVECDKCRLHARVKVNAFTTVIKASSSYEVTKIERNEIVALLYTVRYFAEAILIVEKMRQRLLVMQGAFVCVFACMMYINYYTIRLMFDRFRGKANKID